MRPITYCYLTRIQSGPLSLGIIVELTARFQFPPPLSNPTCACIHPVWCTDPLPSGQHNYETC